MSSAHWMPPPEKDFNAAKRQYVEQFGSVLVMNTYLKVGLLALSLVCVGLIVLNIKTFGAFRHLRPLVVRIDAVGRAEAVRYDSLEYRPQEAEIKYFLIDFVQRHYSQEIEVQVTNVSIEDLRSPPYKATVDFEKVYYTIADHQETRREKYIANFVFVVKENVPNAMIPVNPLGLTIVYFRQDQAFQ
jgi:type IV secretory pathway TrbF-like protein